MKLKILFETLLGSLKIFWFFACFRSSQIDFEKKKSFPKREKITFLTVQIFWRKILWKIFDFFFNFGKLKEFHFSQGFWGLLKNLCSELVLKKWTWENVSFKKNYDDETLVKLKNRGRKYQNRFFTREIDFENDGGIFLLWTQTMIAKTSLKMNDDKRMRKRWRRDE